MTDLTSLSGKVYTALKRRGTPIILRQQTSQQGLIPNANPPTLINPVVNGAVAEGAEFISIRADAAVGGLVQGDILTINGMSYTVQAPVPSLPVNATNQGFSNIQILPNAQTMTDGTTVVPTWSADLSTYATIGSFSRNIVDGDLIQQRDLRILISSFGLSGDPQINWRIVIGTSNYAIISKTPVYAGPIVTSWWLQAR